MPGALHRSRGFSLLELIVVLLLVGALAAVAAPRMDAGRGIRELGYFEQVLADLRLAQRRATADRCEVRVAFSPAGFQVEQRAALCVGPFNRAVPGTGGAGSSLGGAPPEGMALAASPAIFYFDDQGRVLAAPGGAAADVTVTVGQRQIDLVGATGHASF